MGKSTRGSKEYSREQRLVHENQRLKRQVGVLRKQLARLDLDRYDSIKDILEEHSQENKPQTSQEFLENLKKTWACNENGCQGYLEIILYNKINSTFYYRRCTSCVHRTKSKAYDPQRVKGIIKKEAE